MTLSILLSYILVPPNLSFIATIFIILYVSSSKGKNVDITLSKYIKKAHLPFIIIFIILAIPSALLVQGVVRADYHAYQAQQYFTEQNGELAYQHITQSTQLFPYSSNYRRNSSIVESAVGFTLLDEANKESSESSTKQEKQNLAVNILSQAISNARSATVLNPKNVINWENLGNLYTQLNGVAENSNSWAIASYQQAVSLDPVNPINRYRLGIAYANANDTDRGLGQLLTAIELRDSYPDPYIAMAQIYAARNEWQKSLSALDASLKLLPDGELKTQLTQERDVVVKNAEEEKAQIAKAEQERAQNQSQGTNQQPLPQPTPQPTPGRQVSSTPTPPRLPFNLPEVATNSAVPTPQL